MPAWVCVGAGGFLGAVARWALSGVIARATGDWFPFGTLAVNVIGSLLIGFVMGLAEYRGLFTPEQRLFLVIGGLGAFTTFSTFSHETFALLIKGENTLAIANIFGNVVGCLAGTAVGRMLARSIS